MNRLQYWITAQTQYSVHSPFVFEMYRKVLFARLPRALSRHAVQLYGPAPRHYCELLYKLVDHYHLTPLSVTPDEALLQGDPATFGEAKVVCAPHSSAAREAQWQELMGGTAYGVSIDMFDVGLLLNNPKLHHQHFILR